MIMYGKEEGVTLSSCIHFNG